MATWDEEQAADEARSNYEQRVKRAGLNLLNTAQAFQLNIDVFCHLKIKLVSTKMFMH